METRNMKVGEVYRYKHSWNFVVQIEEVYEYRLIYRYVKPRHDIAESYKKDRWNEDFVLLTKLDRLLEGLDEL